MNNRLNFLIAIASIFCIAIMGCTNKKIDVEIHAENIPEGIRLAFNHIPPETTRIFVHISKIAEDGSFIPVFADIMGEQLDQVKAAMEIVCPFVLEGLNHVVGVNIEKNDSHEQNWIYTEIFVTQNGIHVVNNPALVVNEMQTSVTLSAVPVFSADVQYYIDQKFIYNIISVYVGDNSSFSTGGIADERLTWEFYPEIIVSLTKGFEKHNIEIYGDFSANVIAYSKIIYENILWFVGIAQSDEFTISLVNYVPEA